MTQSHYSPPPALQLPYINTVCEVYVLGRDWMLNKYITVYTLLFLYTAHMCTVLMYTPYTLYTVYLDITVHFTILVY